MVGKIRLLRAISATAAAVVMSGGVAWATSGPASSPAHVDRVHAADETSTLPESTSTSVDDTTTTVADTTSTTEPDTTTTTVDTTTTTVDATTTTIADTTTTTSVAAQCKPGWGYGDTNHCHSGPPGLNKHHAANDGGKHN